MAEKKKGFGDALLDLFVVREEGDADKSAAQPASTQAPQAAAATGSDAAVVDDLIARYAQGDAGTRKTRATRPPGSGTAASPSAAGQAVTSADGSPSALDGSGVDPAASVPQVDIDVSTVLRKAGLSAEDQDRVEKTLNLLHTLPNETPVALKRQIVAASLSAFGISVDQIVESALLHQSAFLRHQEQCDKQTKLLLQDGERRLAELQKEAARIQQQMNEQHAQQQGLVFAVSRQKNRLQGVLEFFGSEVVERVQQTSVKLRSDGPEK